MLRNVIPLAVLSFPILLALTACPPPAAGEGEGEGATGEGEGTAGEGEGAAGEGEGAAGEGEGAAGEGEGAAGEGEGEGEGAGAAFACTTGTVIAGDIDDANPQLRAGDNVAVNAAPYIPYERLIFSGTKAVVSDQLTVRFIDFAVTPPKLHNLAGTEATDASASGPDQGLVTGPCAQAAFASISDLAFLSDGSILVSDATANAILKITSPFDSANCTVAHFAGSAQDHAVGTIGGTNGPPTENLSTDAANPTNGAVATATFTGPEQLAIDSGDVVYVRDGSPDLGGSDMIRKITGGQVSTVVTSVTDGGFLGGMTLRNHKLALWSQDGQELSLAEADLSATSASLECHSTVANLGGGGCPTNAADDGLGDCICDSGFGSDGAGHCVQGPCVDLLRGRTDVLQGGDSSAPMELGGIQNVTQGYVLLVDAGVFFVPQANPTQNFQVAGKFDDSQSGLDFDPNYGDPTAAHAALNDLEMPIGDGFAAETGVVSFLSLDATDNVYVSAQVQGVSITKIDCAAH